MINRLRSGTGQVELTQLLLRQELVQHDQLRAQFLVENGTLEAFAVGQPLITLGELTTDVYFILIGTVKIHIGKHIIRESFPSGNHVGEIAAIQITARTATVAPVENVVALKLPKECFLTFLETFPAVCKTLALDFARRLESRNAAVAKPGKKHRIFAISSAEALKVAESGVRNFSHEDRFEFVPWPIDTFRISSYPLDDLEAELSKADFAIAIAQDDDIVESRGDRQAVPRDNVLFELGLFMGRLGRKRTILMAPKGKTVKLPSDLTGISVVYYPPEISSSPTETNAAWLEVKDHFGGFL